MDNQTFEPQKHYGKGPQGWMHSDQRIYNDVCAALAFNHEIDATEINVNVDDASVFLSGSVFDKEMKDAATECVENIFGVKEVKNELRILR